MVYRDELLADLVGSAFICDPTNNLIHREVVSQNGVTFTSRRADDETGRGKTTRRQGAASPLVE